MGDCLLLTGPVRAVKQEFPGFRISVVVESRFAGCFDGNPDFHEIVSIDGKFAAARRLLLRRFDAVVNLHGGTTSLAYAWMTRGPRIGFEQYRHPWLYHGLLPAPDRKAHTVESTMAAFRHLGSGSAEPPCLRFEYHEAAAARMRAAAGGGPYAVVNPGALMDTKRWAASRFSEVARFLNGIGMRVVVTSGPGEESAARALAGEASNAAAMTGLTIPELAETIRGARLYIGNDSGPMHLAAAVGTPTVAIWGSSDSNRWHPWRVPRRVVQNPFECNPCPGYRCLVAPTPLCIESVSVKQAIEAIELLLSEQAEANP